MSKFRFRLDTLLKIRAAERQQKRVELAQAYQAEQLLDDRLEQLELEREATRRSARVSVSPGTVNIDTLISSHRYELLLETQARMLQQQRSQLQHEIELRRAALVEADRQVRVLEKLRERQQRAHQSLEQKHEAKQLDEVGQRSARSQPE